MSRTTKTNRWTIAALLVAATISGGCNQLASHKMTGWMVPGKTSQDAAIHRRAKQDPFPTASEPPAKTARVR